MNKKNLSYTRMKNLKQHIDIDVHDVDPDIATSFLLKIDSCLKEGKNQCIRIDTERVIHSMGLGRYLLEYLHTEKREQDKFLFSQINIRTREMQTPEILATFDYNHRYYLALNTRKRASGQTNDMMFEGIIVNPQKYLARRLG
jgi:hypothetical protein